MKSKISFCNLTVLKKDVTRFLPVWLIYLILALLVTSTFLGNFAGSTAITLAGILSYAMPAIILCYALVTAITLFGDLFNSRMCNALHAMPLRRETLFFTHYLSGLAMFFVPNLLLAVILMATMGALWYVALIWLGAAMLMYLFFFSLAVLCVILTGNRFAAILIYALFNFFVWEYLWIAEALLEPMLEGVRLNTSFLNYCSPVVKLSGAELIRVTHVCPSSDSHRYTDNCLYAVGADAAAWVYLAVIAVIGICLAGGALALYRKRHLESAGDFAAFTPVRWIVSVFGSIVGGIVFATFGGELMISFLFVGITVGFFLLEMLLQRKVKIFSRAALIKWGAIMVAMALVLICGAVDICGLETYVPDADRVSKVIVSTSYFSDYELNQIFSGEGGEVYRPFVLTDDPAEIQTVLDAHAEAIEELQYSQSVNPKTHIVISYRLKGGRIVTRFYNMRNSGSAYQKILALFGTVESLLGGISDPSVMRKHVSNIHFREDMLPDFAVDKLIALLYEDAENGLLSSDEHETERIHISLEKSALTEGATALGFSLDVPDGSASYQYLAKDLPQLLSDPEYLFGCEYAFLSTHIDSITSETDCDVDTAAMLDAIWKDAESGKLPQLWSYHSSCDYSHTLTFRWHDEIGTTHTLDLVICEHAKNAWELLSPDGE